MKLADGVHTFAQLPAVMQDVKVAVKTNDATTYVLTVTTAKDEFDTPNLRGNDAPVPSIDPVTRHWKIGEEDTGVVAEGKNGETYDDTDIQNALSALQGIIAGLNQSIANVQQAVPTKLSQLQNDDHAVKDADYVHTDNNYSDEEKTKIFDRFYRAENPEAPKDTSGSDYPSLLKL